MSYLCKNITENRCFPFTGLMTWTCTDVCIKIIFFFFSCASAFFSHICSIEFLFLFSNYYYAYWGLLKHKWLKANKRASGSSLSATFIEMWQPVLNRNENCCQLTRYLIDIFAPTVFELWVFAVSIFPTEMTYLTKMKIYYGIQIHCSC